MAYTVAQAEVTVLPDAKNFGKELRAQIGPEADKIGREIGDKIAAGMRERMTAGDVDVMGVDTTKATAKVDTFLAETKAKAKVAGSEAGRDLGKNMADGAGTEFNARGALIGAAVGLGLMAGAPLMVAAAGTLFGGLAAVIVHNVAEVETAASRVGTEVMAAYKTAAADTVPYMVLALDQIRVAAVGMAPAVGKIFHDLQPAIQGVSQGVIQLAQNALPGLSAAISNGTPVFQALQSLLASIGTGLGSFFSTISEHGDAMGTTLAGLGVALDGLLQGLGSLVGAGSELGAIVLPALGVALQVLADVLGVLEPILPGLALGFLAFKAAAMIAPLLGTLAGALDTVGIRALMAADNLTLSRAAGAAAATGFGAAATGARGLMAAMGPIGWIMAGISLAIPLLVGGFGQQDKSQEQVKSSAEAMTSALQQSKGAIDDNVRAQAALEAQKNGLLDWASTWGVSTSTVVDALLGVPGAMEQVNTAAAHYEEQQKAAGIAAAKSADGSYQSALAAGMSGTEHEKAGQASESHRKALSDLAGVTEGEVANQNQLKGAIEGASNATETNKQRLQDLANAASAGSTEIGLLKGALDALQGKVVTTNEAEAALTLVIERAKTALEGKSGALLQATGALNLQSEAGATAYQTLGNLADGSNKVIASMIQQGASSGDLVKRDGELRQSFIDTATSMGIGIDEAGRLADELYGIPSERKTEIEAKNAAAARDLAQQVKDVILGIPLFRNSTITVTRVLRNPKEDRDFQDSFNNARGHIVSPFAGGGFQPMQGGVAAVVAPNTWRVIGDRLTDDEAYIPINDSARSLDILAQTASRMGYGLAAAGGSTRPTDGRSYHFQISSPADPRAIARSVHDAQLDLEFLHG